MTTAVETPEPPRKRIHGAWYSLVALPGLIAIAILATHIPKLIHAFTHMRLPTFEAGTHEIELQAGENTIYVEGDYFGDDPDAHATALASLQCTVRDPRGEAIVPVPLAGHESYTVGDFTGVGQFDVEIPDAGRYTVSCTPSAPARFSIGIGFPFMSVVWCLLALFLALPLTGVVGYVINRIRNPKKPKVPARVPNRSV